MDEYNTGVARAVVGRYSAAYHVARAKVGFGDGIKIVGVVVGLLLSFAFLALALRQGGAGVVVALIGFATGGCVALLFYVIGTLVAAQGQMLTAVLDTAVNTSPLL